MGSGVFALEQLKALMEQPNMQVLAVVTQPRRLVGRKQELIGTPVYEYVKENFPDLQLCEAKNSKQIVANLDLKQADFIVVADYGVILRDYVLESSRIDCINVHGSILPKYRGASPIQACLLHGDKITGVSIMRMAEAMDAGDVYKIVTYEIEDEDVAPVLYQKLAVLGAQALVEVLNEIVDNKLKPVAQDESQVSFCGKINKEDALVDFELQDASEIWNKYRAYYFWPKIFFRYKSKKFVIHDCQVLLEVEDFVGRFKFDHDKQVLVIKTKDGYLGVKKIQVEGKSMMSAVDFWNGYAQSFEKA